MTRCTLECCCSTLCRSHLPVSVKSDKLLSFYSTFYHQYLKKNSLCKDCASPFATRVLAAVYQVSTCKEGSGLYCLSRKAWCNIYLPLWLSHHMISFVLNNQQKISKLWFQLCDKNRIFLHQVGCADSVVEVGVVAVGLAVAVRFQDVVHLPQELSRFLHTLNSC